jgi:hypothetical protein
MGSDRLGALQSLGVCRVHLQVIDHATVDHFCLGRGHPDKRSDQSAAPGRDAQSARCQAWQKRVDMSG